MRAFVLFAALAATVQADMASRLYKQALRAEEQGKDLEAFLLSTRASGLRPQEQKYRMQVERLRVRAAQSLAALGKFEEAGALDPENGYLHAKLQAPEDDEDDEEDEEAAAPPTAAEIRQAEMAREPTRLRPNPARRSFDLRGDTKTLYDQVLRAYGVSVVFDPDYQPSANVRFRLEDAGFVEAIHALMTLSSTFIVPLNEHALLVAADTQQKRTELEPTMATLLPIPQVISAEEANEIGRAVQQALDIKRLVVDATRRQVYVRDTVTRVSLARALYENLSRRRGEVMIEVDLISASHSSLTNLGVTLPTSFPVTSLSTFGNATPPNPGSKPLIGIGGGDTLFGVQIGDADVQADWTRSQAQLLSSFRLRATDGLAASLHIGDRYPILNAIFSPIAFTDQIRDLQNSGQLRTPFPSFTFEDLGLVMKVTPRVHDRREISLTIEAEFRLLTGASLNGIPVISSRKFSSAVRLREGQASLVAGLAVLQRSRSDSGFAFLAQIPLIGWFFKKKTWQNDQNELVLLITPRITTLPPGEQFPQRTYYSGTESRLIPPI